MSDGARTAAGDGASLDAALEKGFSRRISDPRATRLFFDELARQRGVQPLKSFAGWTKRKASSDSEGPGRHGAMAVRRREPLVTFDDLSEAFEAALRHQGIEPEEAANWEPTVVTTRISTLEKGTSASPARQIESIAGWHAEFRLRPALLVAEEVSGSIYRKGPRVALDNMYDDLISERLRDPKTGAEIKHIVCWMFDRFTREPETGEKWITALRARAVGLHETYYRQPPKPMHLAEAEIRGAFQAAAKEVQRLHERVVAEFEKKASRGEAIGGLHGFGHHRVEGADGTVRHATTPEERRATETVVQMYLDGSSQRAICRWLNENGFRNGAGGLWCVQNLKLFLRAPRLAGLVRLRADPARQFDPSYEGDLFPEELIYEEGGSPDPDFDPPIEPIIPYPLWARLQEALRERHVPLGRGTQHLASGFVKCQVCGHALNVGGSRGVRIYRCPTLRNRRAPNTAVDVNVHPSILADALDVVLEELIFAAYELAPDPTDGDLAAHLAAARDGIDAELRLLREELSNINHMFQKRTISRRQFDKLVAANTEQTRGLRSERRALVDEDALRKLPADVTLRDLWPEMPLETRCEWLGIVLKEVSLRPASAKGAADVMSRLEIAFRPGFSPPAEELETLYAAIDAKARLTARRPKNALQLPEQAVDALWTLYEQKLSIHEIGKRLSRDSDAEVREHDWRYDAVKKLLKRLCDERGVPFVLYYRDRWTLPRETRELMVDLYLHHRSWASVGIELNKLGITRPHGGEWSSEYVRTTLLRHAELENMTLPPPKLGARLGRKVYLSEAMRQKIWKMHRVDGKSCPSIARWLTERGIKTASGKTEWSTATVKYTVKSVDRERQAQELEQRAA